MMSKGNEINVGSIEEDIRILQEKDCMWHYPETRIEEAIENIIADYTRQKEINEEHQKINGELRQAINTVEKEKADWIKAYQEEKDSQFELLKRIQELEEENKKLKAQHVFTRNKATDEEKAELFDTIDKTLDTFLEKEKPIWQQEMKTNKMSLVEALNIVDLMYQDRYKIVQENNTIYAYRLKDVKFTNLEFASVRLLREVQSLQYKLENSIPKQVVIDKIEEYKKQQNKYENELQEPFAFNYFHREALKLAHKIQALQELLEGEK